jgi:hypothetical protein
MQQVDLIISWANNAAGACPAEGKTVQKKKEVSFVFCQSPKARVVRKEML